MSSGFVTTSQETVSPALVLPSMTAASVPIFESLCKAQQAGGGPSSSPLDYIDNDPERTSKQAAANARVRALLKSLPKPKNEPLNQAPEYIGISLSTLTPEALHEKSQSLTPATQDASDDSDVVELVSEVEAKGSRQGSAAGFQASPPPASPVPPHAGRAVVPPLGEGDPPWMAFLGHGIPKEAPSKPSNWKEALHTMNNSLDFFGRLHEEVCALALWLDPTPEELLLRQRVLARVSLVAKALWPHCDVRSFGSYYTGVWLPNGDMDVCILNVEGDAISNLRILTLCLDRLGIPLAVEIISSARVPIVKFIDSETGVPVDISLNTDSAISTTNYVLENLRKYPWLRPLILLMKLYLQQRALNETYKGGVGSYLLFVLCLSFLQQHRVSSHTSLTASLGLGHLLFDFLQLYGRDFNFETTGISVTNGGCYFPKSKGSWFNADRPGLLAVESPLAPGTDLGRNSYDIRTVRNCLRQSFLLLAEKLYAWEQGRVDKDQSVLEVVIFPEDPLFKNRVRFPIEFNGTSCLERSPWWKEVEGYFGQPIGMVRPPPTLPKCIEDRVCEELKVILPGGAESAVKGLSRDLRQRKRKRRGREDGFDRSGEAKRLRAIEPVSMRTEPAGDAGPKNEGSRTSFRSSIDAPGDVSKPTDDAVTRQPPPGPTCYEVTGPEFLKAPGAILQSAESCSTVNVLENEKGKTIQAWD